MKKFGNYARFPSGKWGKIHLLMKLKLILLLCCANTMLANTSYSQQTKFNVRFDDKAIVDVIRDLRTQTGYDFAYVRGVIPADVKVSLTMNEASIEEILNRVFTANGLDYSINGNVVIVTRSRNVQQPAQAAVTGTVVDADGNPLPGATVSVKGSNRGVVTGADGRYSLTASRGDVVVFSYLGKQDVEVTYSSQQTINVTLVDRATEVEKVVVTGIIDRRAESFTGSATTMTGADLMRVGNGNVFQSLRNLDPTLYIMDNMEMGSDPNTLPTMTMRGTSTFTEMSLEGDDSSLGNLRSNYQSVPNMPLFILDGFETSAQKIFDLDMNRIASVTLLKDAAAKAIYGSKAAHGVVVIETVKLQSSKPMITYTGSFDIQMPDLSSYNMSNAMDKLDIEFKELYYPGSTNDLSIDMIKEFYDRRREVLGGLEVDWMSKPVRVGFGQKHSVIGEMGENNLRVLLGASFNNVVGVMKGSDRTTISGNVNINYRIGNFRISNNMEYTHNDATDSPFGSYSAFTRMNPYENIYDEFGQIRPIIDSKSNPYYDGIIKTKILQGYKQFTDNLQIEWNVAQGLTVRGRLGIDSHVMEASTFYPSNHSTQIDRPGTPPESQKPADQKGLFRVNNGEKFTLSGNLTVSYNRVFAEKHFLMGTVYTDLSETSSEEVMHEAVGLPSDNMDDILYAMRYKENSRPTGMSSIRREAGFTGIAQYSYDDRLIADFTLRTNATSMFGSNNRWATFWSLGLGWNIHNERFITSDEISQLRLRASIGTVGNQNFMNNRSLSVYEYVPDERYNGKVGSWLQNMENPDLKWEQSLEKNVGFDVSAYGLTVTADLYHKSTKNTVTNLAIAPSTGFTSVSENIGTVENKGFEVRLNYRAINTQRAFLNISGSVASNKNTITKISDAMEAYNDRIRAEYSRTDNLGVEWNTWEDQPVINPTPSQLPALMYEVGNDQEAIWAVRSAGIDPATGIEAFYGRDGQLTYIYRGSDLQVVGTSQPRFRGTFGVNGEWNGLGFSVTCRYLAGGQYYNSTLRDKVENIVITDNFDRRALTERWMEVDQTAYFKRLSERDANLSIPYHMGSATYSYTSTADQTSLPTKATSRFVQDRNELDISQVSVYYNLNPKILKKLRMSRLRISAYMNDVAKFSTIGIERGTEYPFARTISFSITGTF